MATHTAKHKAAASFSMEPPLHRRRRLPSMASPPPLSMASPPALIDDAVGEILLRLPPDDPASLLRACLVCKPWRRLLTSAAFLRRYRRFHRTPPMLGFLSSTTHPGRIRPTPPFRFVPTAPFRPRLPDREQFSVLDCRHGRVLLLPGDWGRDWERSLLVWDPAAGEVRYIRFPPVLNLSFNMAVLCAAADCDHLDCHGSPFLVVAVGSFNAVTEACVYSSEAGAWSEEITLGARCITHTLPPIISGGAMYSLCDLNPLRDVVIGRVILRYDFYGEGSLSVINGPEVDKKADTFIVDVDGGMTFAALVDYRLELWSLVRNTVGVGAYGVAEWTKFRVIQLQTLLPATATPYSSLHLVGYAKESDSDVIFVGTNVGLFAVGLNSPWTRKVREGAHGDDTIFPYLSFFTPDRAVGRLPLSEATE